ncbi:MAG: hypothetical protein QM765_18645 [Myxococcales bacterium]
MFASGTAQPGTYVLSGDELNYATCGVCVLMVDNLGTPYMVTSGTVVLTSVSGNLTGTLTNATFEEVTIDGQTYESTPVAGGCQSSITSVAFDAAITTSP